MKNSSAFSSGFAILGLDAALLSRRGASLTVEPFLACLSKWTQLTTRSASTMHVGPISNRAPSTKSLLHSTWKFRTCRRKSIEANQGRGEECLERQYGSLSYVIGKNVSGRASSGTVGRGGGQSWRWPLTSVCSLLPSPSSQWGEKLGHCPLLQSIPHFKRKLPA